MTFERRDGDWLGHLLNERNLIQMPEIDIEIPLVAFYEGVPFGDPAAAPSGADQA